ncbi:hypothetical protein SAMN04488003_11831 [Loktanella fryxellensis]|uniref:SnoaL-like domain-containing protein n=1 Tax=Loktanella fryxellensis TaxID=245187 RepID=A0A1H8GXC3_9RHOB|nr:hypothetical protein [Loktanella fryxellensis]SEN48515.1 hypothetical protein SAMN04488003_11831 [Loktanella fryxellensis]
MTSRDPFACPFPSHDADRRAIWTMLVPRDIDAFVAADWAAVADDFLADNFTGISGHFQPDPQGYTLAYPNLDAYRTDWLAQAQDFARQRDAGAYAGDPRSGIHAATRLEEIEITGDTALVRKKFDGHLPRTDGPDERMNWQTLYWCRKVGGQWKIAGFIGYLPHIKDA